MKYDVSTWNKLIQLDDFKWVLKSILDIGDANSEWKADFIEFVNSDTSDSSSSFYYDMLPFVRFTDEGSNVGAYTTPDHLIWMNAPDGFGIGKQDFKWEFIYFHECMHQLWNTFGVEKNIERQFGECDHELLNIASDCVINDFLHVVKKMPYPVDGLVTPEWIEKNCGVVYDRKTDTQFGLYEKLLKVKDKINNPPQQPNQDSQGKKHQNGSQGGQGGSGQQQGQNGNQQGQNGNQQGQNGNQQGQNGSQGGQGSGNQQGQGQNGNQQGQNGNQQGQNGSQGGQGQNGAGIDNMSADEAAKSAQSSADYAKASADSATGKNAKKAQDAAKKAQKAADEAKSAAQRGDTKKAREKAREAAEAAREAAEASLEDKIASNGTDSSKGGNTGGNTPGKGNLDKFTGFKPFDEKEPTFNDYKRMGDKVIKKYAGKISGPFGDYVSKCRDSMTQQREGVVIRQRRGAAWNKQLEKMMDVYIHQEVIQKQREVEQTYHRVKRGARPVRFGDPIQPGTKIKDDKLNITLAFWLDRSGSMGVNAKRICTLAYELSDKALKEFSHESVVGDFGFKYFVFDDTIEEVKKGTVVGDRGGTLPMDKLFESIEKSTKDYLINIVITDAQFSINKPNVVKLVKSMPGMFFMIANTPMPECEDIQKMTKNQFVFIQADNDFTMK